MKTGSKFPAKTALAVAMLSVGFSQSVLADSFLPGNLIVSRTDYTGLASTVAVGQALPGGGFATADGSFPNVFKNEVPDPSFGVSSAIFLEQMTTSGALLNTMAIDSSLITSSFASKSELALNVSTNGQSVSFMGYAAPLNQLDVSNSNTSQVNDTTNPVKTTVARAIASVNLSSGTLSVTDVNAYSGNNGRAAIEANGQYYMVGNAGNGSATGTGLSQLNDNTGVQRIAVGSSGNTTAIGAVQGTFGNSTGYQHGFSLAQLQDPSKPAGTNYAADKTGKDDNFRGMTVSSDGTLFVTKGSGSNGVNTVYQVGATGALANGGVIDPNAPITILKGFNTLSEKVAEAPATLTATPHPFGLWFGDSKTLFVADEGDGVRTDAADLAKKVTTFAGLQEWNLVGDTWIKTQTFQMGLVGVVDTAASTALGWSVQEDGLRNISGQKNADGSFTIYGTTSTVSNETTHDLGADPNEIVSINIFADSSASNYSTAANTSFTVLSTALAGQRFGGVAVAPVPVPAAAWLFGTGLIGLFGATRKRKTV